jgi:hypothetical protein
MRRTLLVLTLGLGVVPASAHAADVCLETGSGRTFLLRKVRLAPKKILSFAGFGNTPALHPVHGTAIVSQDGTDVALGITEYGTGFNSNGNSATFWNISFQVADGKLDLGDTGSLMAWTGRPSTPLGVSDSVVTVVDCDTVPPIP